MIMVICRKKDSTEPGIYGPICIFPMLCTLFGSVFVNDVVEAIGPKDTFDGSAQGKSPFVDDVDKSLVVGRVEGRTGVQVERVEIEVVLRFEGNNNESACDMSGLSVVYTHPVAYTGIAIACKRNTLACKKISLTTLMSVTMQKTATMKTVAILWEKFAAD